MDHTTYPTATSDIVIPDGAREGDMVSVRYETLVMFANAYVTAYYGMEFNGAVHLARWGRDFADGILSAMPVDCSDEE